MVGWENPPKTSQKVRSGRFTCNLKTTAAAGGSGSLPRIHAIRFHAGLFQGVFSCGCSCTTLQGQSESFAQKAPFGSDPVARQVETVHARGRNGEAFGVPCARSNHHVFLLVFWSAFLSELKTILHLFPDAFSVGRSTMSARSLLLGPASSEWMVIRPPSLRGHAIHVSIRFLIHYFRECTQEVGGSTAGHRGIGGGIGGAGWCWGHLHDLETNRVGGKEPLEVCGLFSRSHEWWQVGGV